ncbi:hypothetical protein GA0061093_1517 [Rhodococcus qingshengii]|nr:hypothetical protein GA0061093_1517 [Rhodococcus qingshengii]
MEWFVSIRDEESDFRRYRGGSGSDLAGVMAQVVAAGREIACREDGAIVAMAGNAVVDGTPMDSIPFGDFEISDEHLLRTIEAAFHRVRHRTDSHRANMLASYLCSE